MSIEKGTEVFIIRRGVQKCILIDFNETHVILKTSVGNYIKENINNIFLTQELAQKFLYEDFKKNDLVNCIINNKIIQGIVINITNLNVSVLINDEIKRVSKNNLLKLNRQK